MVSSRDRIRQRSRWSVRPSPERRRLRFSFQINNVKDPIDLVSLGREGGQPRRLAPGGGGGGYLVAAQFAVNRRFWKIFGDAEASKIGTNRTARDAEAPR
jgi:hypothetical protein